MKIVPDSADRMRTRYRSAASIAIDEGNMFDIGAYRGKRHGQFNLRRRLKLLLQYLFNFI